MSQETRCSQPFFRLYLVLADRTCKNSWISAFLSNMRLLLTFQRCLFLSKAASACSSVQSDFNEITFKKTLSCRNKVHKVTYLKDYSGNKWNSKVINCIPRHSKTTVQGVLWMTGLLGQAARSRVLLSLCILLLLFSRLVQPGCLPTTGLRLGEILIANTECCSHVYHESFWFQIKQGLIVWKAKV